MKLKIAFNLFALVFAMCAFTNTSNAQAIKGESGWVLTGVEMSDEDAATFISLLAKSGTDAYSITSASSGKSYGSLGLDRVNQVSRVATNQTFVALLAAETKSECHTDDEAHTCTEFYKTIEEQRMVEFKTKTQIDNLLRRYAK